MGYQYIGSMFYNFVRKHACDKRMDRQTDGLNYYPQDRASIPASRGKMTFITHFVMVILFYELCVDYSF